MQSYNLFERSEGFVRCFNEESMHVFGRLCVAKVRQNADLDVLTGILVSTLTKVSCWESKEQSSEWPDSTELPTKLDYELCFDILNELSSKIESFECSALFEWLHHKFPAQMEFIVKAHQNSSTASNTSSDEGWRI